VFGRRFGKVFSTTFTLSCSTSFAAALFGQPSVSFVPRCNRLDDVSGSLLALFFVNYNQVCLIFFHSWWKLWAEVCVYQRAVNTVRGFLASFPWVPRWPLLAWFPVLFESEQLIRSFRLTDTRYFCSKSCNAKTTLHVRRGERRNFYVNIYTLSLIVQRYKW